MQVIGESLSELGIMGHPVQAIEAAGKTMAGLRRAAVGSKSNRFWCRRSGRAPCRWPEAGSLASTSAPLAIPLHEAMHGKSAAQLVQMRRAVGAVLIRDLGAVDSQMLHRLAKIVAGRTRAIGSAFGQDEKEWSLGSNAEQALAQFEERSRLAAARPPMGIRRSLWNFEG